MTEVDNLNLHRLPDGSHDPAVLAELLPNLITAAKEGAMPYSVSTTEHEYQKREGRPTYVWLGHTAVENAMSGYRYHKHPAALKRVDIEVDEARDTEERLRPGVVKIFISPRMSATDAPRSVAKQEHLANEDSVRASWCVTDEQGGIQKRIMQSLLVRDVPLTAWASMLKDKDNVFGTSIELDDENSAVSVMSVHRQLEVSAEALPGGVVDIVRHVARYISDDTTRAEVERQIQRFSHDQETMHKQALSIAERWQEFEIALADSLHYQTSTFPIEKFIVDLGSQWSDEDLALIKAHQAADGHYRVSRELAAMLESAKQNLLWVRAAVATNNEKVLAQMTPQSIQAVRNDEMRRLAAYEQGMQYQNQSADIDREIAEQNAEVGGGCPGESNHKFRKDIGFDDPNSESKDPSDRKNWKKKIGPCRIPACPNHTKKVELGPCDVCIGRCQGMYDRGKDPSKESAPAQADKAEMPQSEVDIAFKAIVAAAKAETTRHKHRNGSHKAGQLALV